MAVLVASVAIYAYLSLRSPTDVAEDAGDDTRDHGSTVVTGVATNGPNAAMPGTPRFESAEGAAVLQSQESLRSARLPIATVAGPLAVVTAPSNGPRRLVTVGGVAIPELRDDEVAFAHRAVYPDREVVVGFSECSGTPPPCGFRRPFWLVLRAEAPPTVLQVAGLWTSSGAGSVRAANEGVQIDLGTWNGEKRIATLTSAGEIEVSRRRESARALGRDECRTVIRALDACAASRDCRSFQYTARSIPRAQWADLTRMYHETTGFDALAFRGGCVRACQLGLTPSESFIRRTVCSGARAGQWAAGDPAAGLVQ
jgi:hypothetical protein